MQYGKKILAAVIALTMVLAMTGCSSQTESAEEQSTAASSIRLGTGGIGGNYYAYGNALNQLVTGDAEEMAMSVKTTAGSAANLRLISEGFLEMGIVQSDILADAAEGTGLFEESGAIGGYSAVAGLYTEACQVIVAADSDIEEISDLQGRSISVGEEESGVVRNAQQILQAYGLTFSNVDAKYLSFADSAAAMQAGEIEAFFCTAGAPTTAVTELAREMDIRILSIDEKQMEQMMSLYNGFTTCVIPAGTYQGQTEDVTTVGVKAVLVAGSDVAAETVQSITEAMFTHADELKYATSADTTLDLAFATEDIPVGFHSGAAAYYSAQGVTVEEAEAGSGSSVSGGQDK